MLVIWKPEDGADNQQWMFDPEDVGRKAAERIEATFGDTYDVWLLGLQKGAIKARAVLLWHMLCQVHPKLQYKDLPDFAIRQLKVEQTVAELKVLLARVQKMNLPDDQREQFKAAFELSIEEAAEREGIKVDIDEVDGVLAISAGDGVEELDLPKAV